MAKQNTNSKQGFTIIEVVLVLAIAGLIFLMVFVALPALQRSQRDTARRNDMSRVDTSLIQYQTNNQNTGNGDLPNGPSYWPACKDSSFTTGCATQDGTGGPQNPDVARSFVQRYMNSGTDSAVNDFKDPDGTYYGLYISENIGGKTLAQAHITSANAASMRKDSNGFTINSDYNAHIIFIVPGGKCSGEYVKPDTPRHFAVLYRLEGAGIYCIDDQ